MDALDWQTEHIGVIRNFLSKAECEDLIASSEKSGYGDATINDAVGAILRPDIRNNTRVISDDMSLADQLWQRLAPSLENPFFGHWRPDRLNERMRFYKYTEGQQFDWHLDGTYDPGDRTRSVLTFMVYLNEEFEGGETVFGTQSGTGYTINHRVKAETGMALLFFHRVLHKGSKVASGTKYVLRSDVMFERLAI